MSMIAALPRFFKEPLAVEADFASLLPAAASSALLRPFRLSPGGFVSIFRRISASGRLRTSRIIFDAPDHLLASAGLDQRSRSILP